MNMYEREQLDLKVRIAREADCILWNVTRNIYPVLTLLMQADYELYNKYDIQGKFRKVRGLHRQLEEVVRAFRDELTERRQSEAGVSDDD